MEKSPKPRKLSGKQLAFCEAYLANGLKNATEAAKIAGYKGTRATLASVGGENLRKPRIREYIDERLSEMVMGADEVLERLSHMARADVSDFVTIAYREDGDDIVNIDEDALKEKGYLIKELRSTKEGPVIKLHDSQSALTTLAKHHALLTEKIKHEQDKPLEIIVRHVEDDTTD